MVLFGMPSIGFSNWFFGRGYNAYPHLYNRFNIYYTHTVGEHHIWTHGNAGFMSAAHRAFGPASGTGERGSWLTNSGRYGYPGGGIGSSRGTRMVAPMGRMNTGGFHAQSWGGSFGGTRSFGGGGFHGGGHR